MNNETFYEWRQAQALSLAKGCFSLAGLILGPLLGAMFDPDATVRLWHVVVLLPSSLLAAWSGVLWHLQARAIHYAFIGIP
jgi:hypothetical protein